MDAFRRFFYINARDLNMQRYTMEQIAQKMEPVDDSTLRLPWGFAENLSFIVEHDQLVNKVVDDSLVDKCA